MANERALSARKASQLQARGGFGLVVDFGGIRRTSTPFVSSPLSRTQVPESGLGPFPPAGGGGMPGFGPGQTVQGISTDKIIDFVRTGGACDTLSPGTTAHKLCEAAVSFLFGGSRPGGSTPPPLVDPTTTGTKTRPAGDGPCKPGTILVPLPGGRSQCVALGDAFPGGDPFTTTAGMQAVQGSFGMPAITPTVETPVKRSCPTGMVLGKDNLCYPRAVLPRRSNFRKWKGPKRPPLSVKDANAIRRAERAKERVKSLAKDVGFSVKKR